MIFSRHRSEHDVSPVPDEAMASARVAKDRHDTVGTPLGPGRERVSHLWSDALGTWGTRALQLILVIVLAGGVVYALHTLTLVVLPLMLDIILASALWPLVRLLRRKISPLLTAWVVLLGAFVVLGGIISGIVATVVHQWSDLATQAVEGFGQVQDWVRQLPVNISQGQIDEWLGKAGEYVTSAQFGAGALSGLSSVGEFFTGLGLTLVILFFFLKDGDRIWQFFMSWLPERNRAMWERAGRRARDSFGGYARGTTIVAAVDAFGIGLVMAICGVPLAFPLAVIVFLGAYIPMIGATVAGVLSVLVTLVTTGLWQAVAVAIGTVVVQQLEGHLLQPIVMGTTLHLHGLVILLSLAGGTVLGGFVGALIAVPLVAAGWAMVKVLTGRESPLDDTAERKRHRKARRAAKRRLKAAKAA